MRLAVIPARGGSKRIPGKNIRSFCGQPLISYSIRAAIESGMFDHVVVSTDSDDIRQVALDSGAEVPFLRPAELADDFVGTGVVIQHAIKWFTDKQEKPEFTCCIYPTAPLLTPALIISGFQTLQAEPDRQFAFSVTHFPYTLYRALESDGRGGVRMLFPENFTKRTQDLPEAFHDAGQFYWGRSDAFINNQVMFASHSVPVFVPRYRVMDIDDEEDWVQAEFMYQAVRLRDEND